MLARIDALDRYRRCERADEVRLVNAVWREWARQEQPVLQRSVYERWTNELYSARAARRKKWICLGILIALLIIIAVVVAVYFGLIKPKSG
jgi:hypothetical protein